MKAFENWYAQNENDIWASEAVGEELAEIAWKAALEWAKTQKASMATADGDIHCIDFIPVSCIDVELEIENERISS